MSFDGLQGLGEADAHAARRTYVGKHILALSDFPHKVWAQFGKLAQVIREPMWRFFSRYYCRYTEKPWGGRADSNPVFAIHVVSHGKLAASHRAARPVEALRAALLK